MTRPGVVTGERVVTPAGGFNPTWQRHVAAYALTAPFLPQGLILDLGCGVGHSYELLAPRETVGVDIDATALEGQARRTVVADMRELPFGDGEFAGVVAIHSLEHVPDPEPVMAEAARVLAPGGTAVFVTPNRLTFGRPDEIIDPYHHVEFDPGQLRALARSRFARVGVAGIFGSPRYMEIFGAERRRLDRVLRLDPLRVRRLLSRRMRQRLYDRALTRARHREDPVAAAIRPEDFDLRHAELADCLDVVAICSSGS